MSPRQQILYPAKVWFIALTLILALLANLLPWPAASYLPDWFLLALLHWALYQPRRIGFLLAFAGGLLMDVAHGQLLGQYALCYSIQTWLILSLARRLLLLRPWQQLMYIAPMLLGHSMLLASIRHMDGGHFPGAIWFLPPLLSALLWPLWVPLLQAPQQRAPRQLV